MNKRTTVILPQTQKKLSQMGEQIRLARLRRHLSAELVAESYAGGGSMTENIDKAGGEGTGAFAKQVIDIYTQKLL